MNFKALLLVLAAATVVSVSAFAQQEASAAQAEFRPHLYGQVQGGVAFTRGETVFYNLLSPAGYLSVGYQFTPAFGLRVVGGGWQGKGNGLAPLDVYKYNFLQGNADLTLSLSSLAGFNPSRVLDLYGFVGGGALYAFNNGAKAVAETNATSFEYLYDTNILPVGRVGVGVGINLTNSLTLTAEGNLNIISDRFNSKNGHNPDFQYNALVGLKYAFGGRTKKVEPVETILPPVDVPVVPEKDPDPVQPPVVDDPVEDVQPVEVDNPADHNICVFFERNQDIIRPEEDLKIVGLADYLKAHPAYNVALCGYADVQTGNAGINEDLSIRRSAVVKDRLVELGIAAGRIATDHKGDRVQPFEENDLNRVVISTIK